MTYEGVIENLEWIRTRYGTFGYADLTFAIQALKGLEKANERNLKLQDDCWLNDVEESYRKAYSECIADIEEEIENLN